MEEISVVLRQAVTDDVGFLLDFIKADEWDYSEYDYNCSFAIDPEFLVTAVDCSGIPAGFGGITRVTPSVMYLDTLIVKEDLRHKGIGSKLWKAVLQRAGDTNVCLDSVYESLQWYKEQGFMYETIKLHSYSTVVTREMKGASKSSPYDVKPLSENMWPSVMEYDKQVFLDVDRAKYLRLSCCGAQAFVVMFNSNIVGFGFIHKKSNKKYGIRNLLGDNEAVVESILQHMTTQIPDESEIVYSLFDNKRLPSYLNVSCKFHGTTIRLCNKSILKINPEKIWLHSVNSI